MFFWESSKEVQETSIRRNIIYLLDRSNDEVLKSKYVALQDDFYRDTGIPFGSLSFSLNEIGEIKFIWKSLSMEKMLESPRLKNNLISPELNFELEKLRAISFCLGRMPYRLFTFYEGLKTNNGWSLWTYDKTIHLRPEESKKRLKKIEAYNKKYKTLKGLERIELTLSFDHQSGAKLLDQLIGNWLENEEKHFGGVQRYLEEETIRFRETLQSFFKKEDIVENLRKTLEQNRNLQISKDGIVDYPSFF